MNGAPRKRCGNEPLLIEDIPLMREELAWMGHPAREWGLAMALLAMLRACISLPRCETADAIPAG